MKKYLVLAAQVLFTGLGIWVILQFSPEDNLSLAIIVAVIEMFMWSFLVLPLVWRSNDKSAIERAVRAGSLATVFALWGAICSIVWFPETPSVLAACTFLLAGAALPGSFEKAGKIVVKLHRWVSA